LFADDPSFSPHTTALAVGVTASPTPATERISLTLPEINRSHQVWLIASGAHKAKAVNESLLEGSQLPAALAHGTEETLWWTDQLAAAQLPS
ncbi:6-phosphogluconolactonase, partial [Pseudomonas sp. FW300-N1A5]